MSLLFSLEYVVILELQLYLYSGEELKAKAPLVEPCILDKVIP